MGKLKAFEIIFAEDDVDLFRAGDWVEGYMRIVLADRKKDIRGIEVQMQGKAKTEWEESEGSGDNSNVYFSREMYFEENMLILGKYKKDSKGEKIHLDAGEHKFPFKFQIPSTSLPHPFEGQYGRIRYRVRAKIDRPWKFDHVVERLFSIVGAGIDLNNNPEVQMPSKDEGEKTVCCLCCASGPIKVSVQTDKTGYVPGETIKVSGFIDNQSSRDIDDITFKLMQKVTFKARREGSGEEHQQTQIKTLAKNKGEGCDEYSTSSFDRIPLVIRACPPSGLEGCSFIDIEYYVECEAAVSVTPLDVTVDLPITIGTVPLDSAYDTVFPPGGVVTQQPSAPPGMHQSPSYEIALGGLQVIPSKSGFDYTFGKLMYAPRYAYYNFPHPGDPTYLPPAKAIYPLPKSDPTHVPPPHQERIPQQL